MKNNPKILTAWTMYDWANSVHSLTITSAIFPIYFAHNAVNAEGGEMINFLGFTLKNSVVYSYAVSFAFLLLVLIVPVLSGISDYLGKKKFFLKSFCYLGGFSCMSLFFFTNGSIYLGVFGFLFSVVGWGGGEVFYSSYLPDIATEDRFDSLSARGFTMGYIGSVILLIQNLSMTQMPQWYGGINEAQACRIAFLTVGIWWITFAQIPFYFLPNTVSRKDKTGGWLANGISEIKKTFQEIKKQTVLKKFLSGFFFYNMGAQTVIFMGTMFGVEVLKLETSALIITILLIQLVAIPGAYIFSTLSTKIGNIVSLMIIVCIWISFCFYAYFVQNVNQFYILACGIGLVMGGVQSLSRSTYAKILPDDTTDTASYFSFYDVCNRSSTVIGTFIFGFVNQVTGNMRNSIVFLVLLFLIGLYFLNTIKSQKSFHYKING